MTPKHKESLQERATAAGYHFQAAGFLAPPKENWVLINKASGDVSAFATLREVDARLQREVPDGEAPMAGRGTRAPA